MLADCDVTPVCINLNIVIFTTYLLSLKILHIINRIVYKKVEMLDLSFVLSFVLKSTVSCMSRSCVYVAPSAGLVLR